MMAAVMDQQLQDLERARAGDSGSFALLIEPLLDPGFRLAAVMLADRTEAEDAVQEAALKAWRKVRQLRGDVGSLRSWFLSIVANECRMIRRRRWWQVVRLAAPPPAPSPAWRGAEGGTDLRRALLKLSAQERLPLILFFYLDLPLEEVARILGVSPAGAKSRIYRAARRLRPDLAVEEVL